MNFNLRTKKKGQMFILATMLIAVYIVAMASALMNIQTTRLTINQESLLESYRDSKREIVNFMELTLAKYSNNNTSLTVEEAKSSIKAFINSLEQNMVLRGFSSEIHFLEQSFTLSSNQPPYENISEGAVYTSEIGGEFSIKMTSVSSHLILEESFSVQYVGRVEVDGNIITVQYSNGNIFRGISPFSIFILNGTEKLQPTPFLNQTGIFYFEGLATLSNIGILNVTLANGVRILS
ncbi:MAG: hypothetical protein ACTSW1_01515 [Candidatus Hodarchaeales archaeon]